MTAQIWCGCNSTQDTGTGGYRIGGSADVTDSKSSGGYYISGAAIVDVVQDTYDGYAALWPLHDGPLQYTDLSRFELHGFSSTPPVQTPGVFCSDGQYFDGLQSQYIEYPQDSMIVQPFTVSCWISIDELYRPRIIYSRGYDDTDGNRWTFTLGYSYLNHIICSINTEFGKHECFSLSMLSQDKWYHVAASYTGTSLQVYVNGVLEGESAVPDIIAAGNGGYMGRWLHGGYMTGSIQEVRLHPVARSTDWLRCEYENFCDSSFVTVGDEVEV